jgi:hypothetical protein
MKKNTIWKYPFDVEDSFTLRLPEGAEILDIQVQHRKPCLWCLVDPDCEEKEVREFLVFGTGHTILNSSNLKYIGTFQLYNGDLIFHLFEKVKNEE